MSLKESIFEDLKSAMKQKDEVRVRTLRMVVAAIKNALVDKKNLSDEDVLGILHKEIKQRQDAIAQYEKAERDDLAQAEAQEKKIIQQYLPQPLSEEELRKIITQAMEETGANSPQDLGKVMAIVMPQVKGRADGKAINTMVRDILSSS